MTTREFEEWLAEQDFPVEETMTKEKFIAILEAEFNIKGGSIDVAKNWYDTEFDITGKLGIYSFDWLGQTRWAIKGLRGAFGARRAFEIAAERAAKQGWIVAYEWLEHRLGLT